MKKYKFNQLVVRHMLNAGAIHSNMAKMTETACEEYIQNTGGMFMFRSVIPAKNYNSFIKGLINELQGDTPDVFIKSYWTRRMDRDIDNSSKLFNMNTADLFRMYNRSGIPSYQGAARIAENYGPVNGAFNDFIDLYGLPSLRGVDVNALLANDAVYNFKRLVKLGTRIRGVSCPSSRAMTGFTVHAKLRDGEFGIFIKQRLTKRTEVRESLMSNFLASIAAFYEQVATVDYVRTSTYTTGVPTAIDHNFVGEVIVTLKSKEDFKAVPDSEPEIEVEAEKPEIAKDPVTKSSLEDAWHAMQTQRDIIEHELTVQREEIKALEASYYALDVRREKLTVAMSALMELL